MTVYTESQTWGGSSAQREYETRVCCRLHSCVTMETEEDRDKPVNRNRDQIMHMLDCLYRESNLGGSSAQREYETRVCSRLHSCVTMETEEDRDKPVNKNTRAKYPSAGELGADLIQFRCGVCEQILKDPVITTTCGHSFCRQCISSHWEQPGSPGDQACPQCGKKSRTQPLDDECRDGTGNSKYLHSHHTLGRKREQDEILRRAIENHKASLTKRFENISEGIIKPGAEIPLNEIYTELYITEEESEVVNKENEVWLVDSVSRAQTTEDIPINCNDIFKPLPGQQKHIRTVMTKGVAGIGKTVAVQKFILDWIEGVANQNIDFMFPFSFRELNLVRGDQYSFHKMLLDFHPELKELNESEEYKDCQVLIIFDGLDESQLTLDFEQNIKLSDVKQTSSVDVLMTSLITGMLFPSALIWITSRPAAAAQIPGEYIDQVTEVHGFNDLQKEEYFRKRIGDMNQTNRIIKHIKTSRSLHILCHIPVFCWISATVLKRIPEQDNTQEIPKTLTEMFVHFLLIQITRKDLKYQGRCESDNGTFLKSHKDVILKLSELALKNLLEGNLMFNEEDLRECGIGVHEASAYSGLCTEIFKEEFVFHQKMYSFVHLSVQEFLAALHVFVSFKFMNEELDSLTPFVKEAPIPLEELLEKAADKALQSKNGHLDLFLRFLMGISLERNHRLLLGLFNHPLNSSESIKKTCKYIKELNKDDISPERCINLFFCLLEINDHFMHQEILEYLEAPKDFKGQLSPANCSALAHILLMSEEVLDEFDAMKCNTSDEGRRRLIPALRCCRKARFARCKLTDKSCENIASVLQSPNCLIELDLSVNALGDSGVQILSEGLSSPYCKLQTLRFADCKLTGKSCENIASAVQSPNSLTELDLSHNDLGDSGVQLLSKGLSSPHCKLQILRLSQCQISDDGYICLAITLMLNPSCVKELDVSSNPGESAQKLLSATLEDRHLKALRLAGYRVTERTFGVVASVLQSTNSMTELDLSHNDLGDSGVQLLSEGLSSLYFKLTLRPADCKFTDQPFEIVAAVLQSPNTFLQLDLSHNDLGDSGVELLCKGLSSPHCKLQTLRLSDCFVSEKGCGFLASALTSNPSHLKELDLSYNHPGESGVKLLSARLDDPVCKLEILKTDHASVSKARPRLLKYACKLTLDPNTAHRHLSLSEGNRKVSCAIEVLPYPDHPERFDCWDQVLCREGLSGRCYWEAEWSGGVGVHIAVAYKSIQRKGKTDDVIMGHNAKSWSLICSPHSYSARHNNKDTDISAPSSGSRRVGVYLDWPAGTLSFYSVSSDTLTHLHTFHSTFTEPLYLGFGLDHYDWHDYWDEYWADWPSVSLCQIP